MIAIPIDIEHLAAKTFPYFDNAPMFALYDSKKKEIDFRDNPAHGDGIKTAEILREWKVEKVVYSILEAEPFGLLLDHGIDIYYIGLYKLSVDKVIEGLHRNHFIKVTYDNAPKYIDPRLRIAN